MGDPMVRGGSRVKKVAGVWGRTVNMLDLTFIGDDRFNGLTIFIGHRFDHLWGYNRD
jgi:hypothetical protein